MADAPRYTVIDSPTPGGATDYPVLDTRRVVYVRRFALRSDAVDYAAKLNAGTGI